MRVSPFVNCKEAAKNCQERDPWALTGVETAQTSYRSMRYRKRIRRGKYLGIWACFANAGVCLMGRRAEGALYESSRMLSSASAAFDLLGQLS